MSLYGHRFRGVVENPEIGVSYPVKDGKTQQQFKKDADVNHIMKKYRQTGVLGDPLSISKGVPFYGDFSKMPDLAEQMEIVREANENWERLPAETRLRFQNKPEKLVEFVMNENNRDEATKLGLMKPVEPPVDKTTLKDVVDALKEKNPPQKMGEKGGVAP